MGIVLIPVLFILFLIFLLIGILKIECMNDDECDDTIERSEYNEN